MYYFRDIDDFILWNEPFYNNFNRNELKDIMEYKSLKEELIKNVNYQWKYSTIDKRSIKPIIKKINAIIYKYNFCIKDITYID